MIILSMICLAKLVEYIYRGYTLFVPDITVLFVMTIEFIAEIALIGENVRRYVKQKKQVRKAEHSLCEEYKPVIAMQRATVEDLPSAPYRVEYTEPVAVKTIRMSRVDKNIAERASEQTNSAYIAELDRLGKVIKELIIRRNQATTISEKDCLDRRIADFQYRMDLIEEKMR